MPKRRNFNSSSRAKRRRFSGPNTIVRARRRGYYRVQGRSAGALVYSPETKYFDTLLSDSALTASTNWTGTEHNPTVQGTLFVPNQGTAINNRVGRKVAVQKIKIRGILNVPAQADQTGLDSSAVVRLVLVQDKQSNGGQMQGEELMQAPATATARLANQSFQSLANFGRFRVLKDMSIKLEQPQAVSDAANNYDSGGYTKPFKISINFRKPVIVHFNATDGGTFADIVDNSFHLIAQASTISTAPTISYNCRTVFTDI